MKCVVVNEDAIKNNFDVIRQRVGENTRVFWVVKGNAYGLDTAQYVKKLTELGATCFATADAGDAVYIKSNFSRAEVLLLTPVNSDEIAEILVKNGITASIENAEGARLLGNFTDGAYPIHIKLDVGFGRYGARGSEIKEVISACRSQGLCIEGVFTHLPKCADKNKRETLEMIGKFFEYADEIKAMGIAPRYIHALGSVGVFRFWDDRFTAVRVGSAMTGRMPSVVKNCGLIKVASLECSINSIKHLHKGEKVGYSGLFKAKKDTASAVLDVGYGDGFSVQKVQRCYRCSDMLRHIKHDIFELAGKEDLYAQINGNRVKAIGSIGMTATSFDISGKDVKISDTAIIDVNPIYINPDILRIYTQSHEKEKLSFVNEILNKCK